MKIISRIIVGIARAEDAGSNRPVWRVSLNNHHNKARVAQKRLMSRYSGSEASSSGEASPLCIN